LPRILKPGRLRQSAATFINNLVKRGDAHPEQPCPSAAALYDTNLVKRGGAHRVLLPSKHNKRYETNSTTTSNLRAHGTKNCLSSTSSIPVTFPDHQPSFRGTDHVHPQTEAPV
jgi:hypothetical protein